MDAMSVVLRLRVAPLPILLLVFASKRRYGIRARQRRSSEKHLNADCSRKLPCNVNADVVGALATVLANVPNTDRVFACRQCR